MMPAKNEIKRKVQNIVSCNFLKKLIAYEYYPIPNNTFWKKTYVRWLLFFIAIIFFIRLKRPDFFYRPIFMNDKTHTIQIYS